MLYEVITKKQYNYYRDQLLTFEEGEVEWKPLGEVAELITKGTTPKKYTRITSYNVCYTKLLRHRADHCHLDVDRLRRYAAAPVVAVAARHIGSRAIAAGRDFGRYGHVGRVHGITLVPLR